MARPNEFLTNNQEFEMYSDNVSELDREGKEYPSAHQKREVGKGGEQYNDTANAAAETVEARPRQYVTNGQEYEKYRDADEPVAVNKTPYEFRGSEKRVREEELDNG